MSAVDGATFAIGDRALILVDAVHFDEDGHVDSYRTFLEFGKSKVELTDWLLTDDELAELEVENREQNRH